MALSNVNDAALLEIDDPFTKELIEIWSCLNFKKQPSDFSDIPIWYNSFVWIDNKPIYYKVRVHMNVEPRSTMNTNGEIEN